MNVQERKVISDTLDLFFGMFSCLSFDYSPDLLSVGVGEEI